MKVMIPLLAVKGTTTGSPLDNKEQDDEDHPLTPDVCSGTLDLIMDQLIQEQHEPVRTPTQQDAPIPTGPASIQSANVMVDPLQVLLTSAPPVMDSPTITKGRRSTVRNWGSNHRGSCGKATPQPIQDPSDDVAPDDKDDFKLTTADVGDNMEDI